MGAHKSFKLNYIRAKEYKVWNKIVNSSLLENYTISYSLIVKLPMKKWLNVLLPDLYSLCFFLVCKMIDMASFKPIEMRYNVYSNINKKKFDQSPVKFGLIKFESLFSFGSSRSFFLRWRRHIFGIHWTEKIQLTDFIIYIFIYVYIYKLVVEVQLLFRMLSVISHYGTIRRQSIRRVKLVSKFK